MKNYISFVNDHSGSMECLARAAAADFNANVGAIKDAATREMLDTVVSVSEVGHMGGLSVTVSNPHVLRPVTHWRAVGGTPLWNGILNLINMLATLPDINKDSVSSLVLITTDGEATDGIQAHGVLAKVMAPLIASGRWTFVARVPANINGSCKQQLLELGIMPGNIQTWETTAAGMAASTAQTTQAMSNYFTTRSSGAKATSAFYADASKVDITALEDISKKVSLYVVPSTDNGVEIRPFILRHRMDYLKGSAFYQLTKTEARVSHTKMILVRDRASGKIFAGKQARTMIGLPQDKNARLHPGDHKNFDLFIQSESVNRKLVADTGVVYWKEIGVPFTEADLAYLQPKPIVAANAPVMPVQLPAVPVSSTPTKSPIPVQPRYEYFFTREDARRHCAAFGIVQSDIINNGRQAANDKRWAVPTVKKVA